MMCPTSGCIETRLLSRDRKGAVWSRTSSQPNKRGVLSYFISGAMPFLVAASLAAASGPDFDLDVRPLLEKRCVMCHGAQQQMSGLRLDRRDDALKGGYSGPVLVPGNASASLIVTMITTGSVPASPPVRGNCAGITNVGLPYWVKPTRVVDTR